MGSSAERFDGRFAGRRAVVTGGSRGIGEQVARRLAAAGANLVLVVLAMVHDVVGTAVQEIQSQLQEFGGVVEVVVANLSKDDDRSRVIPRAEDMLGGHVEILVNNAAAAIQLPVTTMPVQQQRVHFEVNVLAPLALAQAAAPAMRDAGEGWIVNLTSGAARLSPGPPFPESAVGSTMDVYGGSKAALNRITNGLAAEMYGTGVRVNAVQPRAAVMSDGLREMFAGKIAPSSLEPMEAMVDAVLALCDCPPEHTGRVDVSVDLLAELQTLTTPMEGTLT
jgi:NAD(P)-dependent dehydrogenase (short-subunit alcohol dehydrogenase family)